MLNLATVLANRPFTISKDEGSVHKLVWAGRSGTAGTLVVDFIPSLTPPQVLDILTASQKRHPRKQLASVWPKELAFTKRFWTYLLSSHLSLSTDMTWGQLRVKDVSLIVSAIKNFEIAVAGKGAFKEEFVTAGGVSLKVSRIICLSTSQSFLV